MATYGNLTIQCRPGLSGCHKVARELTDLCSFLHACRLWKFGYGRGGVLRTTLELQPLQVGMVVSCFCFQARELCREACDQSWSGKQQPKIGWCEEQLSLSLSVFGYRVLTFWMLRIKVVLCGNLSARGFEDFM